MTVHCSVKFFAVPQPKKKNAYSPCTSTSIIISNICCMQLTAFQVHLRESMRARAF